MSPRLFLAHSRNVTVVVAAASKSATGSAAKTPSSLSPKKRGNDVDQGDKQHDFPQQRQQQGGFGLPQGQKALLEPHLGPKGKHPKQEDARRPHGGFRQLRVAGEDAHEYLGISMMASQNRQL